MACESREIQRGAGISARELEKQWFAMYLALKVEERTKQFGKAIHAPTQAGKHAQSEQQSAF